MYFFTIILSVAVFLSGCTTKTIPMTPPFDYCRGSVTLTKNVINGRESYSTNSVTSDDSEISAIVSCRNLSGYHTLRWDWYSPDGNLYLSKDKSISTSAGKFSETASAWHTLKIRGEKIEDIPGVWRVKVFIDSRPVSTSSFSLKKNIKYEVNTETSEQEKPKASDAFKNKKVVAPE